MWMEELDNGKVKYVERYRDPLTNKLQRVSVTMNSKSKRASNEAQRILNSRIDEILKWDREIKNKTLEEVSKEWLVEYQKGVKGRTYAAKSYILDKLWRDYLKKEKNYLINNITPEVMQKLLDDLQFKKKLSYTYVSAIKIMLSLIFKFGKRQKYVTNLDAIQHVTVTKTPITIEKLEAEKVPRYLEKEELEQVLEVLGSSDKNKAEIFFVQAYTGMRVSEVLALQEKDIEGNILHIRGSYDNMNRSATRGQKTTPKNKPSFRSIEISDRLVELIQRRIALNQLLEYKGKDEGYIFVDETKKPYPYDKLRYLIKKNRPLFTTEVHVTSHVFRHTHISMLAEQGVPLHVIMARVGHSSRDTTEKIYLHVTRKSRNELGNILNKL